MSNHPLPPLLVGSSEPKEFHHLGILSQIPERRGCDFLFRAHHHWVGIQRKQFPEDLLASLLSDGRLKTQLAKMEAHKIPWRIILFEGVPHWTNDGLDSTLYHGGSIFNLRQYFGLSLTLSLVYGCVILWSASIAHTIELIPAIVKWFADDQHHSLTVRTPPNPWGLPHPQHNQMLQGLPGVGAKLAGDILEYFGAFPLAWTCETEADLTKIPGIGKKRAKDLWEFLTQPLPELRRYQADDTNDTTNDQADPFDLRGVSK